jgi:GTP-binding protein
MDRAAVVFQVVLTKTDKLKRGELDKVIAQVKTALKQHPAAFPEFLTTSSETGHGIAELRATISSLL